MLISTIAASILLALLATYHVIARRSLATRRWTLPAVCAVSTRSAAAQLRRLPAANQSEPCLSATWECAADPVFVLDRQGSVHYANGAARALGNGRARITVSLRSLGFGNGARDAIRAAAARVAAKGDAEYLEVAAGSNETHCELELAFSPVRLRNGERGALAVGRDISRRKRDQGVLQDNEWLFRTITETAPLVIAINSFPDGRILYMNPQSQDVLGLHPDELVGRRATELYFAPKDRRQVVRRLEQDGEVNDVELRLRNAQGEPVWVMLSARTITFRGERAALVTYHDIDQRKRMEAELEKTHRDIQRQEQIREELSYLANYDPLTQLPNRHLFRDRALQAMAKARRHRKPAALLFIDLDGFKGINDTYGHETGDALLTAVAERLRRSVRESDTVARLGGDEFVIILEALADSDHAGRTAEQVLQAFDHPFVHDQRELRVTPSIGIGLYHRGSKDLETWLREADQAMYRAKREGKNRYTYFDASRRGQPAEA